MLQLKHTGKVRPHHHTSYPALVFMLLLCGVMLFGVTFAAEAAQPAVNPQSGSVGLTGTVPGPAPSTAATILSPANGSHTSTIPVTVSGTCPVGTFVEITKNGVFAGAVSCGADGTFSLLVDLFAGANSLIAQVADSLGQLGPNSGAVSVFYDAPSFNLPGSTTGKQLFLETDTSVLAGNPNQAISRTVTLVGGVAPFAVSFDWGDGATSLLSEASDGAVVGSHTYTRAGTYNVIVRVTDSLGNSAFMQVITVVNGPVAALGATNGNGLGAVPGELVTAWPLYVLGLLMVIFFWLGERREARKMRRRQMLLSQ
jgi:hypothetical protein